MCATAGPIVSSISGRGEGCAWGYCVCLPPTCAEHATCVRPTQHLNTTHTRAHTQDYPNDLRAKVEDNVRNGRHPLDAAGQKGAISVFIGNLPFSVRACARARVCVYVYVYVCMYMCVCCYVWCWY